MRPLEKAFLQATRIRLGLNDADASAIEAKVAMGLEVVRLPSEEAARRMLIETVTQAAEIDGPMDQKEREAIRALGARMGFDKEAPQNTLGEDVSHDVHSLLDALRSPTPVRSVIHLHTTALGLIATNVWVLISILFFRWDVYLIAFTFWAENVVIGFYNVLKIVCAHGDTRGGGHGGQGRDAAGEAGSAHGDVAMFLSNAVQAAFFVFIYFWFTAGHGIFVLGMFRLGMFEHTRGIDFKNAFLGSLTPTVLSAIALMFLAHGHSFVKDYLRGGEYLSAKSGDLVGAPFSRMIVMHVSILFGGAVLVFTRMPRLFCLVLVPLKTLLDLSAHARERRRHAAR